MSIRPLPVISWTLFFVTSILALSDRIELDFGKGMILLAFFITAAISSIQGLSAKR